MAKLPQPRVAAAFSTGPMGPKGTWPAICKDIKDEIGITVQKFGSTSGETEVVDMTTFLFEYQDQGGKTFQIASRRMRISGYEKSNLFRFLTSWRGQRPQPGWDYFEMKGKKALISVDHVQGKLPGVVYASIVAISPMPMATSSVDVTSDDEVFEAIPKDAVA